MNLKEIVRTFLQPTNLTRWCGGTFGAVSQTAQAGNNAVITYRYKYLEKLKPDASCKLDTYTYMNKCDPTALLKSQRFLGNHSGFSSIEGMKVTTMMPQELGRASKLTSDSSCVEPNDLLK